MVDGGVWAHDNCNRQINLRYISTLDPFSKIDLIENEIRQDQVDSLDGSIKTTFITDNLKFDSDSKWEDDDGNIFNVFNIEDEELLC